MVFIIRKVTQTRTGPPKAGKGDRSGLECWGGERERESQRQRETERKGGGREREEWSVLSPLEDVSFGSDQVAASVVLGETVVSNQGRPHTAM